MNWCNWSRRSNATAAIATRAMPCTEKSTATVGSATCRRPGSPATFEHEKYFRFDRHHDTECITCHVNNDYGNYTCYGCHEHSRSKIRGEHVEEGIYDYENCVDCHRSGDEDEAERIWQSRRFEKRTGRPFNPNGYERAKHHHRDDD